MEGEPATMQGKWPKLLDECHALDNNASGTVTPAGFRNALTRTEPRMNMDQVEWFVKDADKNEVGDVQYEAYIRAKKAGANGDINATQDSAVDAAERKILHALKSSFNSLQQAFRRENSIPLRRVVQPCSSQRHSFHFLDVAPSDSQRIRLSPSLLNAHALVHAATVRLCRLATATGN